MKKHPKLKITLIILGLVAGLSAIGVFVAFPIYHYFSTRNLTDDANAPEIADEIENIDFNKDNGLLYINNEIIIMTYEGVTRLDVETLAKEFRAEIATAMEDIGFWQFQFKEAMTYSELNRTLKKIKKSEVVEDAYFNTVYETEPDETDGEIISADPFFPDDPWNGDTGTWNMEVPRGSNWGMEAIHAPAAWGYLNEMAEINIGLIDTMVDINHEDIGVEASFVTLTDDISQTYDASGLTPGDHGTHVSGIMAGYYNNGSGISGVMGDKGKLFYSAAYTMKDGKIVDEYYTAYNYLMALKTLIDNDVKVINISQNTSRLIGFAASRGNENAVNHLENAAEIAGNGLERVIENGKEFVICVAAGNSNDTVYYKNKKSTYGYKENWTWFWEWFKGDSGDSQAKYNNFLNLIEIDSVKSRIIVVGSIGIDSKKSKTDETRYHYSEFSNIGGRVDIVAPGEDIYSSIVKEYGYLSGTSMASPHVSGVAGLIFACNPNLSGSDVKRILLASTTGRFYYTDGYSGLINADIAVQNALQTRDHSVNRVIKTDTNDGLDLCFVVDTTGSMGDDIDNAKENMNKILDELSVKNENFRVAVIDYRDFSDRADLYDYPSKLQLDFSENKDEIYTAIHALTLGDGGDSEETVYSGLMEAAGLNWRPQAQKAIIVLGDAPPLDPEPYTGYTLDSVIAALYNADISLITENAVGVDVTGYEHLIGDANDSLIKVFSIGTDASQAAADFFNKISEATGGSYTGVDTASEVSDAIISTIEQIEILPTKTIKVSFGEDYSGETMELYRDGKFAFDIVLDENGSQKLENMELDRYKWSIPRLHVTGSIRISETSERAKISFDDAPWYAFAISLWQRERVYVIVYGISGIIALAAVIVIIGKVRHGMRKHKQKQVTYKCPNCGAEYYIPNKFCINCGAGLETGNSAESI